MKIFRWLNLDRSLTLVMVVFLFVVFGILVINHRQNTQRIHYEQVMEGKYGIVSQPPCYDPMRFGPVDCETIEPTSVEPTSIESDSVEPNSVSAEPTSVEPNSVEVDRPVRIYYVLMQCTEFQSGLRDCVLNPYDDPFDDF